MTSHVSSPVRDGERDMPLLVFPSSSLSKEISIWLTSLYLLGMGTERGLLLCYSHACTLCGPHRDPLPWEPLLVCTGRKWEKMPKSSMLKPWLLLPEHPRKHTTYDLPLALSIPYCKVGSNSSLVLLAVLRSPDPRDTAALCLRLLQRAQTRLLL